MDYLDTLLDLSTFKYLSVPDIRDHLVNLGKNMETNRINMVVQRMLAGDDVETVKKLSTELTKVEAGLEKVGNQIAAAEEVIQKLGNSIGK